MKLIRDIVFSPEVWCLCIVFFIGSFFIEELEKIYDFIEQNNINRYLVSLPLGLLVTTYKRLDLIIKPDNENKKELTKWSEYKSFRRNAYLALVYSSLSLILSFPIFLEFIFFSKSHEVIFIISSYLISLISFVSIYLASNEVERVLNNIE